MTKLITIISFLTFFTSVSANIYIPLLSDDEMNSDSFYFKNTILYPLDNARSQSKTDPLDITDFVSDQGGKISDYLDYYSSQPDEWNCAGADNILQEKSYEKGTYFTLSKMPPLTTKWGDHSFLNTQMSLINGGRVKTTIEAIRLSCSNETKKINTYLYVYRTKGSATRIVFWYHEKSYRNNEEQFISINDLYGINRQKNGKIYTTFHKNLVVPNQDQNKSYSGEDGNGLKDFVKKEIERQRKIEKVRKIKSIR